VEKLNRKWSKTDVIEFKREGRDWKFEPLPMSTKACQFYLGMRALGKQGQSLDWEAFDYILESLPTCVYDCMKKHHSEAEVNEFLATIVFDFGNPDSMLVLGELNMLFMGLNPQAAKVRKLK
jgi:hypothetical protein